MSKNIFLLSLLAYSLSSLPAQAINLTPNETAGAVHELVALSDNSLLAVYQVDTRLEVRHKANNAAWQTPQIVFTEPAEANYPYDTIFSTQTLNEGKVDELTALVLFAGDNDYSLVTYSAGDGLAITDIPLDAIQFVEASTNQLLFANTDAYMTWSPASGFSDAITLPYYDDEDDTPSFLITGDGLVAYIYLDPDYDGDGDSDGNLFVQQWDSLNNFSTIGPEQLATGEFFYSLSGATASAGGDILFSASTGYTDDDSGFRHGGDSYLFGWSEDNGWYDSVLVAGYKFDDVLTQENKRIQFVFDTALSYDTTDDERPDDEDKIVYRWVSHHGWQEELVINADTATEFVSVTNHRASAYYLTTWSPATGKLQIYKWTKTKGWRTLTTLQPNCVSSCSIQSITISGYSDILVTWQDQTNYYGRVYKGKTATWLSTKQFTSILATDFGLPLITTTGSDYFITVWKETTNATYWQRRKAWQGWETAGLVQASGAEEVYPVADLVLYKGVLIPAMQGNTLILYRTKGNGETKRKLIADDVSNFDYLQIRRTVYFDIINTAGELVIERSIY